MQNSMFFLNYSFSVDHSKKPSKPQKKVSPGPLRIWPQFFNKTAQINKIFEMVKNSGKTKDTLQFRGSHQEIMH